MTVDLESKLRQSQELNALYLNQIRNLEEDNLALCARLQEVKIASEGNLRDYIQEKDQLRLEIKDLLKMVSCLEKEILDITNQNDSLRSQAEEYRDEAEAAKTAQMRVSELAA